MAGRDGRDGGCEMSRRDGTVQNNDIFIHDGAGRKVKLITTERNDIYFSLDGTGRHLFFSTGRDTHVCPLGHGICHVTEASHAILYGVVGCFRGEEPPLRELGQSEQPQGDLRMPLSQARPCLLYTSPSPRDRQKSRMPSSA